MLINLIIITYIAMSIKHLVYILSLVLLFIIPSFSSAATESIRIIRQDCTGYSNCYTSLSAWEAAENRNLTVTNEIAVARIEGTWTNPDTTAVTIDGWTTDATRYIRIYTAPEARHVGVWSDAKYRLSNSGRAIYNVEPYVKIDGIQIDNKTSTSQGILSYQSGVEISNSIIKNSSIGLYLSGDNVKVKNCLIYDSSFGIRFTGTNGFFYNCTYANNATAVYLDAKFSTLKNSIFTNNTTDISNSGFGVSQTTYSATNLGQSISGIPADQSNKFNQTFVFLNSVNKDFHLSNTDNSAKDQGVDLSADPNFSFSNDIDGQNRTNPWDMGSDEIIKITSIPETNPYSGPQTAIISSDTETITATLSTVQKKSIPVTTKFFYVNPSASGKNDGSDWVNAFTDLPASLTRNTLYYLADGKYASHKFSDAGTGWIYIKKAIPSDHGVNTGWTNSMGDGAAVLEPISFTTGNYEIDGQVGGGPNSFTSGHGIKITSDSDKAKAVNILNPVSNLVFDHIEMTLGFKPGYIGQDIVYGVKGGSDWIFKNSYLHHSSRTILYTMNVSNILIENCQLERNGQNQAQHSEIWSARDTHNVVIKNNIIKDYVSTGGIIMGRAKNWDIYGNIFTWSKDFGTTAYDGAIGSWDSADTYYADDINIYNNSFINLTNGGSGRIFTIYKKISNVNAYNNLWHNSPSAKFGNDVTHDYNLFKGSGEDKITETNKEIATGTILSGYHLLVPTKAGYSLGNNYDKDMFGKTRGFDNNWDKGAIEFDNKQTSKILNPTPLEKVSDNTAQPQAEATNHTSPSSPPSSNSSYSGGSLLSAYDKAPNYTSTLGLSVTPQASLAQTNVSYTIIEAGCTETTTYSTITGKPCTKVPNASHPSYIFSSDSAITYGMRDSTDVRELQKILQIEGFLPLTSPVDGAFGPGTKSAIIAFQKKYAITPAQGTVGPLTKTKLNQLYGSTTISTTFYRNLTIGSKGDDVKKLQQLLNADIETRIASSGAGSPCNETTYFGPGTRSAVIKYQQKYHITPASGYVGPLTRTKLEGK